MLIPWRVSLPHVNWVLMFKDGLRKTGHGTSEKTSQVSQAYNRSEGVWEALIHRYLP